MTMRDAVKIGKEIAEGAATIQPHYGYPKSNRGLKICGCLSETADAIGDKIANILKGQYNSDPGFCCVWF